VEAEIAAEKKIKQAAEIDPKIVWKREFIEFKKSDDYSWFGDILESVYTYHGDTYVASYTGGAPKFKLDPRALKIADVNELITIADSGNTIKLTKKGKFFASLYDQAF
jgi:hypothetical protein